MLYTTGDSYFAECRQHSAKALLHSAKALPSAALGKESVGKELFAECQILGTWQRLCRVPGQHSAKKTATVNLTASLPTADVADTRQGIFSLFFKKFLCRVLTLALDKESFFAECHVAGTRQRNSFSSFFETNLCRVQHLALGKDAKLGVILPIFVECYGTFTEYGTRQS